MNTITTIEKNIFNITMKIHKEFPELSKYIAELPEHFLGKDNKQLETKNFKEYYNSLEVLLSEYAKAHLKKEVNIKPENSQFEGYPIYPPSQDIYNHDKEEQDINPEDISKNKSPNENESGNNEKSFKNHMSGDDLDIPGSELDDEQEDNGSEDEENNYYSLGGDNHNNLDEDKG